MSQFFSFEDYAEWARSRYPATGAPEDVELAPPKDSPRDTVRCESAPVSGVPPTLRSKEGGYVLE